MLFHNNASTHSTHETDSIYSRAWDMGKMKGKQKQIQADSNLCVWMKIKIKFNHFFWRFDLFFAHYRILQIKFFNNLIEPTAILIIFVCGWVYVGNKKKQKPQKNETWQIQYASHSMMHKEQCLQKLKWIFLIVANSDLSISISMEFPMLGIPENTTVIETKLRDNLVKLKDIS